jgi:hypothetical protein
MRDTYVSPMKLPQADLLVGTGSSMVTSWRKPYLEHPLEHPITEAVAVGFSGLDICECSTVTRKASAVCVL